MVEKEHDATVVSVEEVEDSNSSGVVIYALNKKAEFVVIKNTGYKAIDLSGWSILAVRGGQRLTFTKYVLQLGDSVKVGDSETNADVDLQWLDGRGTWNNSEKDPAELYDAAGNLVPRYDD